MNKDQTQREEFDEESFVYWLRLARSGDEDARDRLVLQYREYLLLLANTEMDQNLQPKIGASDLVQQSMLAIHQNFDQFRGDSLQEFKGWIRSILRNDLSNTRRHFQQTQQRQTSRERQIDDSQLNAPPIVDQNKTPQSEALLKELAREMDGCMDELSDAHRRVIQMRNWEEKSFVEIGHSLDCSSDAARKLWYRALVRLKEVVALNRPEFASRLAQLSSSSQQDKESKNEEPTGTE